MCLALLTEVQGKDRAVKNVFETIKTALVDLDQKIDKEFDNAVTLAMK